MNCQLRCCFCEPQAPKRALEHHHSWHRGKTIEKSHHSENANRLLSNRVLNDIMFDSTAWCWCWCWCSWGGGEPLNDVAYDLVRLLFPWSTHWPNHDSQTPEQGRLSCLIVYVWVIPIHFYSSLQRKSPYTFKRGELSNLSLCLGIPINTPQTGRTNADS